jgi:2-oxoglutarate dehydrogenase E2 component (dihydrolipoamide succinyltransferase)
MPTNIVMPQMGESVAEGTVVRWIKKVGDRVDRDEPLFEISTDKVDAEIPAPAAGVLTEIRVKEGETVPVDSVVGVIGAGDEVGLPAGSEAVTVEAEPPAAPPPPRAGRTTVASSLAPTPPAAPTGDLAGPAEPPADQRDRLRRTKSSPLVRRIAQEHDVDLARLQGSGVGGRVTKNDILRHLEGRSDEQAAPAGARPAGARPDDRVDIVPMSVMRRKIAEHMVLSRRTSAHVHSVFEVDFHRVSQIRDQKKADYESRGAKLTFMAFIAKAVCDALRSVPIVNASIDGENIVYRKDINLGVAVALDWGLIVPVIKNADEKNLLGLSRAIADLAARARAKQLKPEEVQGGTFTITNPGAFGTLFGMPIINQPQVAILGVGTIEKRVVVIDDAIHVRPRGFLTLGYDHRLVDGAVADAFMADVKRALEQFDPAAA